MHIQHNIPAMNAKRNLRKNTSALAKSLEKLSSGYRINRSADDAAGLAISESMRASISALEQAENNAADGISLVQTADGAMQEIHDMLNRMTTLAAEAANGTLSDEDREKIQEEIDQILEEITRIKNDTTFNEIPLLQGEENATYVKPTILGGLPAWVGQDTGSLSDALGATYNDGTNNHAAAILDFSALNDPAQLQAKLTELAGENTGFCTTCCTCNNHYSIKFVAGKTTTGPATPVKSGNHYVYEIGLDGINNGEDLVKAIVNGTKSSSSAAYGKPASHYTRLIPDPANSSKLIVFDERSYPGTKPNPASDRGVFRPGIAYDSKTITKGDIKLQIGEFEDSQLEIALPQMALSDIGIRGLSVKTTTSASASITKLKLGINYVSGERSRMGSYQNRLEHTSKSLGNTIENLSHAESQIRDVDIAHEMMAYTKNNILIQSAQAMLAQANQVPQGVLQLMQ